MNSSPADSVVSVCQAARQAAHRLTATETETKNSALQAMAEVLETAMPEILAANAKDVADAKQQGVASQLVDRLQLSESVLRRTAQGVRDVAALPDPVGEELERTVRPNGLVVRRVRVPLGVVAIVAGWSCAWMPGPGRWPRPTSRPG